MKIRQWLFLLFAATVAALCIRLGFWQLDRLQERRVRNATIRQGLSQPPVSLDEAQTAGELAAYQRVTAQGIFLPSQEIVLSPRARDGQPGVHLVTPLQLPESSEAILVDRGWIPFDQRLLPDRSVYQVEGTVKIEGFLQPGGQEPSLFFIPNVASQGEKLEWQALNIKAIETQVDPPLLDWALVQTEALPDQQPQPIPDPDLDLSEGPHLGYAIQWFSFAAIAVGGAGYWLKRQRSTG